MAKDSIQDKILPLMVVALIGAAFALGMMWGKVQVYEKGGVAGANVQVEEGQDVIPEEEILLNDDDQKALLVDPAYAFGDENAPVTLVEFTDYECPFCKRYIDDTYGSIVSDYVDAGKVRYVVRDLPLGFHPGAVPAAMAARCANDQGKYMEMHDAIFAGQAEWTGSDGIDAFKGYASDLGLDTGTFNDCMDTEKHLEAVEADSSLAAKYGASGTPSFFVNGKMLVGAQPLSEFVNAIEEVLEN